MGGLDKHDLPPSLFTEAINVCWVEVSTFSEPCDVGAANAPFYRWKNKESEFESLTQDSTEPSLKKLEFVSLANFQKLHASFPIENGLVGPIRSEAAAPKPIWDPTGP